MTHDVQGNTKSLTATQLKQVERLFARHVGSAELVPYPLAKEMLDLATALRRMVGIIVSREGKIVEVVLGSDLRCVAGAKVAAGSQHHI